MIAASRDQTSCSALMKKSSGKLSWNTGIGDLSMKVGSTQVAGGEGAFTVRDQIAAAFDSSCNKIANNRPIFRLSCCKTQRVKSTCRPAGATCIWTETASLPQAQEISHSLKSGWQGNCFSG